MVLTPASEKVKSPLASPAIRLSEEPESVLSAEEEEEDEQDRKIRDMPGSFDMETSGGREAAPQVLSWGEMFRNLRLTA